MFFPLLFTQTDVVLLNFQVGKSGSNVAELGGLANQLTKDFTQLANDSCGSMATCSSQEVSLLIDASESTFHVPCPYTV